MTAEPILATRAATFAPSDPLATPPGVLARLAGRTAAAVDTIPRLESPADAGPYLDWNAETSPELRVWTGALAPDAIALSLRIDPVDPGAVDLSDSEFDATVQVHGLARPGVVCDAVDLWPASDARREPRRRTASDSRTTT
ncbi:hypothetical protein ACFWAY_28705 [Rhodococcus sp. NPDC059968]|uniref:hypothetical protein n=1 Tax=Rhodococcus sp. NPDC059968 TaxID=3347017 RepID=UPI00366ABA8E